MVDLFGVCLLGCCACSRLGVTSYCAYLLFMVWFRGVVLCLLWVCVLGGCDLLVLVLYGVHGVVVYFRLQWWVLMLIVVNSVVVLCLRCDLVCAC